MKKLIFVILIFSDILLYAQNVHTITGTVKDTQGEPIVGAVITLDGSSSVGAVSDLDGKYELRIPASSLKGGKISVSCLSYAKETEDISNRGRIDFVLKDDALNLEEVVVIGYGSMKKSDLTGAVTSVAIDEDIASQSASVDQLIQGRASGVQVINNSAAPDAGVNINIRGTNSFSDNNPLFVVDGIMMNTSGSMGLMTGHSGTDASGSDEETNGLMGINPQDIASIEILKDASATAIYGSQGANGVVLITTKKASTEQIRIKLSVGLDINTPYKKQDIMSYDDYVNYLLEMEQQTLSPDLAKAASDRLSTVTSGKVIPTDWQDYVMQTTVSQRYYLSFSGKPKKTNFLFSLGYNDTKGIIKSTGFKNFTMRANLDRKFGRKVTLGFKFGGSYLNSQLTQGASTGTLSAASSLMRSMVTSAPYTYAEKYDEEGEIIEQEEDDNTRIAGPDRWLQGFSNNKIEYRVNPSAFINVDILKWLSFNSTFGADYRSTEQSKFRSKRLSSDPTQSVATIGHIDRLVWNWDNLLNMNFKFRGKHSLSGTLGMSMSADNTKSQSTEGTNIDEWKAREYSLNSAPYAWFAYDQAYSNMMSFFVRGIYNYRDRYVLTATYRLDGSSRFAANNKWASFPSFAFAWRANQEKWFNVPVISMLKLRLGWGQVGKQSAAPYCTITNYTTGYYPSHANESQKVLTTYTTNFPNQDLKWETTDQTNIGLDFGMWQGRLSLTLEAYYKKTRDLLQQKTIAGSIGTSNPYVNMGSIENKGWELSLDVVPIKTRNFEWFISGNISMNRNKILSINPDGTSSGYIYLSRDNYQKVEYFDGDIIGVGDVLKSTVNIFVQGQPMGLFYGLLADGLVEPGQEGVPYGDGSTYRGPGSVNYVDLNNDGVINDSDRTIIGDPNPDFTYGFSTSFDIFKFRLSANFVGSHGNDIYNINRMIDTNTSNVNRNLQRAVVTRAWTENCTDTWYPALGAMSGSDVKLPCSRYVEDGSYLRLSNVSLAYTFVFAKKTGLFLRNLTIGATAKNPWVWTKYSGWDPDVNSYGSMKKRGLDMGSYPGARTFMFDVKLTF